MCQINLFPQYASCYFLLFFATTDGESVVQPLPSTIGVLWFLSSLSVVGEASQLCPIPKVSASAKSEMTQSEHHSLN